MVTFRNNNNNRRPSFRSSNNRRPSFRRNDEGSKFKSNFSNNDSFQRKVPGRNNHNASKLIEKYNDLAREALANEDKILSENYFQHADHFTRILNEQEKNRSIKILDDSVKSSNDNTKITEANVKSSNDNTKITEDNVKSSNNNTKITEDSPKKVVKDEKVLIVKDA